MKGEPLPIFVHFLYRQIRKKKRKRFLLDDPCKIKYPLDQIYYTHADQDYKNRLNLTHHYTIFQGLCYKHHIVHQEIKIVSSRSLKPQHLNVSEIQGPEVQVCCPNPPPKTVETTIAPFLCQIPLR